MEFARLPNRVGRCEDRPGSGEQYSRRGSSSGAIFRDVGPGNGRQTFGIVPPCGAETLDNDEAGSVCPSRSSDDEIIEHHCPAPPHASASRRSDSRTSGDSRRDSDPGNTLPPDQPERPSRTARKAIRNGAPKRTIDRDPPRPRTARTTPMPITRAMHPVDAPGGEVVPRRLLPNPRTAPPPTAPASERPALANCSTAYWVARPALSTKLVGVGEEEGRGRRRRRACPCWAGPSS